MKKLLVALLVLGLAAPAIAAEVGFYGSFRTHIGYYDVSDEYGRPSVPAVGGPMMDGTIGSTGASSGAGVYDDAGTMLSMSHQSRFGAKAKVTDTLSGVFEMGLKESTRSTSAATETQAEDVYLRLAYGTWNFGAGTLTVGKDYTPGSYMLWSNMIGDIGDGGDAVMVLGGLPYIGRQPQIKLSISGFTVALIEPNTSVNLPAASGGTTQIAGYTSDVDFILPRIEMNYTFNSPMISIKPVVGYQTYDVVNRGATETDKSVDSWLAGLGVQLRFDPAFINLIGSYMINAANYGQTNLVVGLSPLGANLMAAGIVNDEIEDSTLMQLALVVGAKLSPMLKVEAGVSYNNAQRDLSATVSAEQTAMLYYGQMPITVAPGVTIIPEIGFLDRGDYEQDGIDDIKMGDMTYGVVSFRIDF